MSESRRRESLTKTYAQDSSIKKIHQRQQGPAKHKGSADLHWPPSSYAGLPSCPSRMTRNLLHAENHLALTWSRPAWLAPVLGLLTLGTILGKQRSAQDARSLKNPKKQFLQVLSLESGMPYFRLCGCASSRSSRTSSAAALASLLSLRVHLTKCIYAPLGIRRQVYSC